MSKDSKKPTLSDLSKEEQILFLGSELIKLKDLLMVTLDQMNRLNSYRSILSDILEESGIISHKELDQLANDFFIIAPGTCISSATEIAAKAF